MSALAYCWQGTIFLKSKAMNIVDTIIFIILAEKKYEWPVVFDSKSPWQ